MKYLKQITYALVLIGALNWGVYGLMGFDLVDLIFGGVPGLSRIIYVVVGLSAIYVILNKYVLCGCKSCHCSHDCNSKEDCNCKDCTCCGDKSDTKTCSVE